MTARRPGQAQRTRQPVPAHDSAHITMAIDAWRWRLGSLPLEQRSLLEGTYVISRSGQPFGRFLRSHPSLDDETMDVRWSTVAKMLRKGVLE
jgi:hypothetical protein